MSCCMAEFKSQPDILSVRPAFLLRNDAKNVKKEFRAAVHGVKAFPFKIDTNPKASEFLHYLYQVGNVTGKA